MSVLNKKVFISYASEDVDIAMKLYQELKKNSINVWIDKADLLPGMIWESEIQNQIENASHFIALISKNSVDKKGYVQKELKKGLDILREYPESKIYLIPVRLDDSYPAYRDLRKIHWVDIGNDWNESINKILQSISPGEKDAAPQSNNSITTHSVRNESVTVLVVDDENGIRLLLKEVLEKEGYNLLFAKNGEEALDTFRKASPDLTILDVNMPEINGIEVMRRIHDLDIDSPVILYSEYSEYKQDFGTWASEEYIVKSTKFYELTDAVARVLMRKRMALDR